MKSSKKGNSEINVIFCRRSALTGPAPDNTILISPSLDSWNDFGFRSKAEARIHIDDSQDLLVDIYIGFITESPNDLNGTYRLENIIPSFDFLDLENTKKENYFTMLCSMEEYRKVISSLGKSAAIAALKAMRELVVISEFTPTNKLFKIAIKTEIFSKSFVRSSESFFSFKNSGSILRGLKHERFRTFSRRLKTDFKLAKFKNRHNISLTFDHDIDLPKRICVLIGKNGVGKSQTLSEISRALLNGSSTLLDGDTLDRPMFNRLLAFAPTKETLKVFPSERRVRPLIWYRRFSLNRAGSAALSNLITDQLIQVSRSQQYIGEHTRWDIFLSAIEAIENSEQIYLQSKTSEQFTQLIGLNSSSEKRLLERYASVDVAKDPVRLIDGKCYSLSSGESSFLRFAAQASLHIENGSLLLLDEPETHLHPNFINQFVSLLDKLLELTGSAAVIATHSVYFVREVFREQVTILRTTKENLIEVPFTALQTFGSDIGLISHFVFEEDELSNLATSLESRIVNKNLTWDEVYLKYHDKLSPQLLTSIRSKLEKKYK